VQECFFQEVLLNQNCHWNNDNFARRADPDRYVGMNQCFVGINPDIETSKGSFFNKYS